MNQPYARVNQPYATLMLASALRDMFAVQLYKNNAHGLLSRISSILNLDWLQHARSVRGVYEYSMVNGLHQYVMWINAVICQIRQYVKWIFVKKVANVKIHHTCKRMAFCKYVCM